MKFKSFLYLPLLILIGISVSSCEENESTTTPTFNLNQPDTLSNESYEIYSLVIDSLSSSSQVVIDQETTTSLHISYQDNYYDFLLFAHEEFDSTLILNYEALNKNSINFANQFQSETNEIIVISTDEIAYIFDGEDLNADWEAFYKAYPLSGGINKFTNIAFNDAKTQAIFEISSSSASLAGGGSIVYLEKQNGVWIIADIIATWVS